MIQATTPTSTSIPCEQRFWREQGVLLTRIATIPGGPRHHEVTQTAHVAQDGRSAQYSVVTMGDDSWASHVSCDCGALDLRPEPMGPFATQDEAIRAVADRLLANVSRYIEACEGQGA